MMLVRLTASTVKRIAAIPFKPAQRRERLRQVAHGMILQSDGVELQTLAADLRGKVRHVKQGDAMASLLQGAAERGERMNMARDRRRNNAEVTHSRRFIVVRISHNRTRGR